MGAKKRLSRQEVASLEVVLSGSGFTLWCSEINVVDGKRQKQTHWLLDGSMLKEDLRINLGSYVGGWKIVAEYDKDQNAVIIKRM